MIWLYRTLIRPLLFQIPPEEAHEMTLSMLHQISSNTTMKALVGSFFQSTDLKTHLAGVAFPNPLGLAAGMDKNGMALPAWSSLGFGFAEIGGITLHAQSGNSKPRMFRAPETEALVNRMGFNNQGLMTTRHRLSEWKNACMWPSIPVAINLGKSKITPLDEAPQEYAKLLFELWPFADLFIINVSSPNTPNLRKLQQVDSLRTVLDGLAQARDHAMSAFPTLPQRPVFLKIAPDMSLEALDDLLELAMGSLLQGIVATNTTLDRPRQGTSAPCPKAYSQEGGLSGRPLRNRSTELIRHIHQFGRSKLKIIGVGGIFDTRDAWEKIGAGASLLQVYSGLVFQGPGMVRSIVEGLAEQCEWHGLDSISEAVGKELTFRENT
jgi:dihydroorotate dehydrogenase